MHQEFHIRTLPAPLGACFAKQSFETVILYRFKSYDYQFIAENTDLMYVEHEDDNSWISHCLLVMGESSDDGILVESEGADYARYSASQAGAKSYVREQICRSLMKFYITNLASR